MSSDNRKSTEWPEGERSWPPPEFGSHWIVDGEMRPYFPFLAECLCDEMAAARRALMAGLRSLVRGIWTRIREARRTVSRGAEDVSCDVTYQELACYAANELDEARSDQIQEHVLSCDGCRERLDSLRNADAVLASSPPIPPPDETIRTAVIWAAIGRLPERQRQAISLHAFERRDYGQIAQTLMVSTEQAKSLVLRARANLAQALEPLAPVRQTASEVLCVASTSGGEGDAGL